MANPTKSVACRWVGASVAGAVMGWSRSASASGHALDSLVDAALALVAAVPWAISWFLLLPRSSVGAFLVGTLASLLAMVIVLCAQLPAPLIGACVALLPATIHFVRRVRAQKAAGSPASDRPPDC